MEVQEEHMKVEKEALRNKSGVEN